MGLSTRYDPIFREFAGRVPVAYLRALAKRESNMDPGDTHDPAWGLMQVVEKVRTSHNARRGTAYGRRDLLDPAVNVKIASDLLNRIVAAYGKHPSPNLKEDWTNPEFVKLVTAGWNSGYSEAAGVGYVARWLEERGLPVTHDTVFDYAGQAGGTRHLQNPVKRGWQKTVSDLYFQQPDRVMVTARGLAVVAVIGLLSWGAYELVRS